MGFHYSDGSFVGGCGAQIGGLIGLVAIFVLHSLGLGIGWSILIVCIAAIIIMILYDQIENNNNNQKQQ